MTDPQPTPPETKPREAEKRSEYTPTPWSIRWPTVIVGHISDGTLVIVADTDNDTYISTNDRAANADHIVKCVNAHDDLVAALKALVTRMDECEPHITRAFTLEQIRTGFAYSGPTYGTELNVARAALAKAEATK